MAEPPRPPPGSPVDGDDDDDCGGGGEWGWESAAPATFTSAELASVFGADGPALGFLGPDRPLRTAGAGAGRRAFGGAETKLSARSRSLLARLRSVALDAAFAERVSAAGARRTRRAPPATDHVGTRIRREPRMTSCR